MIRIYVVEKPVHVHDLNATLSIVMNWIMSDDV